MGLISATLLPGIGCYATTAPVLLRTAGSRKPHASAQPMELKVKNCC